MPVQRINAGDRVSLGENSRVLLRGFVLRISSGFVEEATEKTVSSSNRSKGFREHFPNEIWCSLEFEGFYRPLDNPYRVQPWGPQIAAGLIYPIDFVFVYPDFVNDPFSFYQLYGFLVERCRTRIAGNGETQFSLGLVSIGEFYTPARRRI